MKLNQDEKELLILALQHMTEGLKPAWNDFMYLKKKGRKKISDALVKCRTLQKKLEQEFSTTLEEAKEKWQNAE